MAESAGSASSEACAMGRHPGRICLGSPGRCTRASSGLKLAATDTLRTRSCKVASRMENCSPRVRHGSSRAEASSAPCWLTSRARSNSCSVCETLATPPRTASSIFRRAGVCVVPLSGLRGKEKGGALCCRQPHHCSQSCRMGYLLYERHSTLPRCTRHCLEGCRAALEDGCCLSPHAYCQLRGGQSGIRPGRSRGRSDDAARATRRVNQGAC